MSWTSGMPWIKTKEFILAKFSNLYEWYKNRRSWKWQRTTGLGDLEFARHDPPIWSTPGLLTTFYWKLIKNCKQTFKDVGRTYGQTENCNFPMPTSPFWTNQFKQESFAWISLNLMVRSRRLVIRDRTILFLSLHSIWPATANCIILPRRLGMVISDGDIMGYAWRARFCLHFSDPFRTNWIRDLIASFTKLR